MSKTTRLIVGAVTTIGLVISLAGPAHAYQTKTTGYTGSVGVPVTDANYNAQSPYITVNARNIGEVPAYANYNQWVCINTRLWVAVPTPNAQGRPYFAMMPESSVTRCGWIQAAQTYIPDNGTRYGSDFIIGGKGYRTTVDVTWKLANNSVIGTKQIYYANAGDFRCLSGNCSVNRNWDNGYSVMINNF